MTIRAGELDKRVQVQQLRKPSADLAAADPYNAPPSPAKDDNWTTVATRWAKVEPLNGRELFTAQQVVANVTHAVTMRHFKDAMTGTVQPGAAPFMRLLLGKRKLNVGSCIDPGELHEELQLLCVEEVRHGS